jgi:protocatechuate 3,4-dioxygenase beta subunit
MLKALTTAMDTGRMKSLSRRQALTSLMLGAAGARLGAAPGSATAETTPAAQPPGTCTLFPQTTAGPFYFDPKLVRSEIAEGRPGLPLQLVLRVIESGPCTPIAEARVDIWHADARGVYSGYAGQGDRRAISTKNESYLRGTQMTDADGTAIFRTIYPGWYPGRTPHIHVKVFLDTRTLVTGQVYFADALSARIYREREPYAARPKADTTNANDFLFKSGEREGGGTVFAIKEDADLLVGSLTIAVDRKGGGARRAVLTR